ncbi:MAG: hypothetical protein IPJ74_19475 [Saprospiraceae bacterium]|nr:hypothetical protein [Saprospiraceae bacterium]
MMVQVNGHWTLWAADNFHDAFIDANDFGAVNTDVIQGSMVNTSQRMCTWMAFWMRMIMD